MKHIIARSLVSGVLAIGLFAGFFGFGVAAEAATSTAACTNTPVVDGFRPYVYEDGDLHSFDYMVAGDFPMTVATVVDGRVLDSNYTTTWKTGAANSRRVHVDVPNWDGFSKDVKISLTIWPNSNAGCTTTKEFHVTLPAAKAAKPASTVPTPTPAAPAATAKPSPSKPNVDVSPSTGKDTGMKDDKRPIDQVKGALEAGKGAEKAGFFQSLFASLLGNKSANAACKSWPFAAWVFLAIICIVSIIVIIDSLPYLLAGNGVRFAIALLSVFLILLALWFIFDRCREHRWFPLVVTLATLGTLIMPTALEARRGKTKKFDF